MAAVHPTSKYQQQNSDQTLNEGLAEYFEAHQEHLIRRNDNPAAESFFEAHDTAHVVFGCDTSLDGELCVKLFSLFGTSAGFSVLRGYALTESRQIYRKLGVSQILLTTAKAFVLAPKTLWHCLRLKQRWPWELDKRAHLHELKLDYLRDEFGIRVVHH